MHARRRGARPRLVQRRPPCAPRSARPSRAAPRMPCTHRCVSGRTPPYYSSPFLAFSPRQGPGLYSLYPTDHTKQGRCPRTAREAAPALHTLWRRAAPRRSTLRAGAQSTPPPLGCPAHPLRARQLRARSPLSAGAVRRACAGLRSSPRPPTLSRGRARRLAAGRHGPGQGAAAPSCMRHVAAFARRAPRPLALQGRRRRRPRPC
jgi:hypothetical protein